MPLVTETENINMKDENEDTDELKQNGNITETKKEMVFVSKMSQLFKYNVVSLIELVESKPCLWNKTADCYKDKVEKQKAWKEVFTFFEKDFLLKDKKEQRKIGQIISGKWQNVHDSFVKSLKKKSGQSKKYIYHDNLTFLLKVIQSDNTHSNHSKNGQLQLGDEEVTKTKRNLSKKARLQEDFYRHNSRVVQNGLDEDEAFFISITPSVRKMSEEDKLEFRMNVLQLIKHTNMNNNKSVNK